MYSIQAVRQEPRPPTDYSNLWIIQSVLMRDVFFEFDIYSSDVLYINLE